MANITRKNQKVFAENAINNGQFGSLKDTTKVLSQDLDVLQANAAYPLGWNSATLTGEELPSVEEFQSLNYINTSQTAYLLNKGIPEWVVDAEYYIGDIQREVAGTKIYRSITNNNIGNILTNITHWVLLVDLAAVSVLPASQAEMIAGVITNKFASPSTLAGLYGNSVMALSGYEIVPLKVGGAFIKGFKQVVRLTSSPSGLYNYPITFPTAVISLQATDGGSSRTSKGIATSSLSQFQLYTAGSDITWVTAIGY